MNLEQHLEIAAKFARSIFLDKKEMIPMVHAIDKDGNHHVLVVPQIGGTDDEKNAVAVALRKNFAQLDVRQYVMILEAWTLRLPPGSDLTNLPRPRDHADRMEAITFQAEAKDDNICGEMIITRDAKGVPSLSDLTTWRSSVIHGRLTGLLQTPNN